MRIEAPRPLEGRRLLVAASGSIAAVKTPLLVSALVKEGAEVRCVVTPSASKLVIDFLVIVRALSAISFIFFSIAFKSFSLKVLPLVSKS